MRYTDVEIQYDASDTSITDDTVTKNLNYTSDSNGDFSTNPTVTITFTNAHTLAGITVNFATDTARKMTVTWTHAFGTSSKQFDIDNTNFVINQSITGCTQIVLTFTKAIPESKINVDTVKYGVYLVWDKDKIKTANLVLETDRIAERLSVNTLTFDIIDSDESTNPGNKGGIHNFLQKRKPVYPHEYINGTKKVLGDFFLENFNYEKNICHVTAVSYISLFDTVQYDKGDVYNNTPAGTVLADIFVTMGITNYTIDSETAAYPLYGALPPCTCKEAIRQILFVCHSVIDTSDASNIKIKKSTTGVFGELRKEDKFSTKVTKKDYVSGVCIKYTHYALSSETTQIINDVYSAGAHRITFSTPYANYTIAGATMNSYGKFYVDFTVSGTQQVIVTANAYQSLNNSVQVNTYDADEDESVKEFSTTLCNITTARTLARKLLNYYGNRFEIEVKYLADDVDMSKRLEIFNPTEDFENYIGIVTSRTFDLTGGFIDIAKFIGYFDTSDSMYYMIDETDEEVIADDSLIL